MNEKKCCLTNRLKPWPASNCNNQKKKFYQININTISPLVHCHLYNVPCSKSAAAHSIVAAAVTLNFKALLFSARNIICCSEWARKIVYNFANIAVSNSMIIRMQSLLLCMGYILIIWLIFDWHDYFLHYGVAVRECTSSMKTGIRLLKKCIKSNDPCSYPLLLT